MSQQGRAWDAHAHWFRPKVSEAEARAALERAFAAGLAGVFLGGIGPEDWEPQAELAREFSGRVIPCYGLHPWWVHEACGRPSEPGFSTEIATALERLRVWLEGQVSQGSRFGMGEIGLDASQGRATVSEGWAQQLEVARRGLELARHYRAPAVLHGVEALPELLALCRETAPLHAGARRRGLLHRYSGSLEMAQAFLKQGFLISVTHAVARPQARRLHRVVLGLQPGELLFESDGPDAGDSPEVIDSARAVAALHRSAGSPWTEPAVWLEAASQSLLELWSTKGRLG